MAKALPSPDPFAAAYPHIARWVHEEEGWIEVGQDDFSPSFVRAVYGGGLAWEGKPSYPSLEEAFHALDAGIAAWLQENRPRSIEQPPRQVRRGRGKRGKP
jgi:hypothetical protein